MEKKEIEDQLKELQEKLNGLKTQIADKEEEKNISPIIKDLEKNAAKLKIELYRESLKTIIRICQFF